MKTAFFIVFTIFAVLTLGLLSALVTMGAARWYQTHQREEAHLRHKAERLSNTVVKLLEDRFKQQKPAQALPSKPRFPSSASTTTRGFSSALRPEFVRSSNDHLNEGTGYTGSGMENSSASPRSRDRAVN